MKQKVNRWELLLVVGLMLILVVGLWGTSGSGLKLGSQVLAGSAPQVASGGGTEPGTIISPGTGIGKMTPTTIGNLGETGIFGWVGIGTASPGRKLHVYGDAALFQRDIDAAGFIVQRTPDLRYQFGVSQDPWNGTGFSIYTYPVGNPAVSRLFIAPDGKVGIGTTSPSRKLEVKTDSGITIYGENTGSGPYGYLGGPSRGAYGSRNNNYGYLGSTDYGVYGRYDAEWGPYGYLGGSDFGVYGRSDGWAVLGENADAPDDNYGFLGGGNTGAYGCGSLYGVFGKHAGSTNHGYLGDASYGVYGYSASGSAGYFQGAVTVTGYLTKSGGGFKIDHPQDPENKYLQHSFVESPDMKNVYDGNIVLDDKGEAVVGLPAYFEALNRDFRYQLTCIGSCAPVYVAEEISNNCFKIAGGKSGLKVSWQVTGIRHDPFANAHPVQVEQEKPADEKGYYLHPKEWGQPEEKGISRTGEQ